MSRRLVPIIICALLLPAGGIRADERQADSTPLAVSLIREPVQLADPIYRAYANAGQGHFTFVVPRGFWIKGDPATGKLTLVNKAGNCTLTFAIIDSRPAGTLGADNYRDLVLQKHPTGKIVQESSADAAGRSGPAFDVQWKVDGDLLQTRRVIFIPSSAGVLEFTATTTRANFADLQAGLNLMLATFRYNANGKVPEIHLADQL